MNGFRQMPVYKKEGLSIKEVEQSRIQHGTNRFSGKARKSFLQKYIESFRDPIIRILLIALLINVLFMMKTGNIYETLGIAASVFLSTFVATLSEYGSESAFIRLQEEAEKLMCRVKRNGKVLEIPITDVVYGDSVLLSAGEKIPADGFLATGELFVDESAINGESKEKRKTSYEKSFLYRGTMVTEGEGIFLVTAVGDHTVYGNMAGELQVENVDSPMKIRLTALARQISKLGYASAFLIAFADLFHAFVIENGYRGMEILQDLHSIPFVMSHLMHAVLLAISVIVMAVPEGLPMMITIVLSSNMKRMQKAGVMVRKLIGIETAGSINLLFTDKTGTLTKGNLSVAMIAGTDFTYHAINDMPDSLQHLFAVSCMGNTACAFSDDGSFVGGQSTERALADFANSCYFHMQKERKEKQVPFDSAKKYSWAKINGKVYIKGAPEVLFPLCKSYYGKDGKMYSGFPKNMMETMENMTANAMRVLLFATADEDFDEKHTKLTFLCLAGIRDSLRPEAKEAVATVKTAGIQTVMITGDNRETAVAIAGECGILSGSTSEIVLTGKELSAMSDTEVKNILPDIRVIARALPNDKSRLVRLSQEIGLVVGMTGDGVNDAAALKRADVGFAMGSGTELAKEAGDIVILDNRFDSITKAVLYGRTIFHSIRKFIVFQLTMNFCAVFISFFGPFIGVDMPVTVTQMLWINMIMDTFAGLAFAGEAPQRCYMEEKPKQRNEKIITRQMLEQIFFTGSYTVFLLVMFLLHPYFQTKYHMETDFVGFMTAFFTLFVFAGICNAVNARTHRIRFLAYIGKNKGFLLILILIFGIQIALIFFGGTMFRTHALPISTIGELFLLSSTVIPFDLMRKILTKIRKRQ